MTAAVAAPDESVEVLTFGCRLNAVESEAIRRAAPQRDHALVILNTCAVTDEAVRQAKQTIRRIARERPQARIAVTGCAAQIEPQTFAAMPEVAYVVGNDGKSDPATWRDLGVAPRVSVRDIMARGQNPARMAPDAIAGQTRGFIEIQNGCDHRCTFCVIPYGRGPSRSTVAEDVIAQARRYVANDYREVVLTGVDITSWGADLPGAPGLGALVRRLLREVPEIARLRLSSIDCIEADDELYDVVASEPRFMPHLHLSLQAGDDMILKRMKRRHARADAIAFCAKMRALRPDIVFGADIIAGFPTETEEMFCRSLDLVEECGLTHLHVFPFSPRPQTPAARMPQVPRVVTRERAARLRAAGAIALTAHLDRRVGRRLNVLTERGGNARTEDFTLVKIDPAIAHGMMMDVAIAGHDGKALIGADLEPSPRSYGERAG